MIPYTLQVRTKTLCRQSAVYVFPPEWDKLIFTEKDGMCVLSSGATVWFKRAPDLLFHYERKPNAKEFAKEFIF